MEQYIDKNTLVAEIIKLDGLNCLESPTISRNEDYKCGYGRALEKVRNFIDTIEVKEVDLEKEIKESIIDEWCDEWSDDVGNWIRYRRGTTSMTIEDVKDIAKHFFELGLKAQKGE